MKSFIIALVACVSLSGCMWQSVDAYDISRATKACGSVDNIVKIDAGFLGHETVRCFDAKDGDVSLFGIQGIRK